ncbi:S-4TM family putative pore-forming effector [Xanthomonas translucens]|uniref:S-4TM family putative pore-forming effector n=1 Tax=Xanthomonas campestris pv. translucens TaxID=343 RepID=UPI000B13C105|nr:S-4TM family putative pore-forming effector [Xanthomonas translucens]QEO24845.1 hypothetical protein F0H32_00205 [Xanthomonas translucens pv. undulosa]
MSLTEDVNGVCTRQNMDDMIRLLRARARIYDRVKVAQRLYFAFTLFLPAAAVIVVRFSEFEFLRSWISLIALVVGLSDTIVFDRWRKEQVQIAAKLQEQFDTAVLKLPWNSFVAGEGVDAEVINRFGSKIFASERELELRNWYPKSVEPLPLSSARFVCQRTNLWYDSNLRSLYRTCLIALGWIYFSILAVFALGSTLSEFILTVMVPFGPFAIWVIREVQRQADTIKLVVRLKNEVHGSLNKFQASDDQVKLLSRARELQDAIYLHRASSPLVSNLVYRFKRSSLESEMDAGAQWFIDRLNSNGDGQ